MEYEDLFQAGCLGLLQAAERFDQGRGVKFSTYAVPLILGEMRRLFREGGAVRVSRGLRDLGRKVQREADRAREGGRPAPSLEELARELGVSPERAALALGALQPPLSLTAGEEGETWEIPVEAPEEGMTERLTLYGAMERMDPGDRELLDLFIRERYPAPGNVSREYGTGNQTSAPEGKTEGRRPGTVDPGGADA